MQTAGIRGESHALPLLDLPDDLLLLVAEHDRAATAIKLREVHSSLARLLANLSLIHI